MTSTDEIFYNREKFGGLYRSAHGLTSNASVDDHRLAEYVNNVRKNVQRTIAESKAKREAKEVLDREEQELRIRVLRRQLGRR